MPNPIRRKILRAALFSGAVIACMELWARIDDAIQFGAPMLSDYSQESMLVLKDSTGVRGRPHGRFEKWNLNSLGFRGPEIAAEKTPGVLRIATMGASETFGIYESPGMEWPRRLEAGLAEAFPGRAFEVVNAAFPGMGLESAGHYYETRVRPLRPDVILLYLNVLPFFDKPKPPGNPPVTQAGQAGRPGPSGIFRLGKPRLFSKLNRALHTRGPVELVSWLEQRRLRRRYQAFPRDRQTPNLDSAQARAFADRLREFVAVLRNDGVTVVLSEHAHALTVWDPATHPEGWLNLWRYWPTVSESELREGYPVLNGLYRKVGEETGCPVVGQADLLADAPDSNFAADGLHFTDRGAGKAAGNFLTALTPILKTRFATTAPEAGLGRDPAALR
jgi:hypothetical protein